MVETYLAVNGTLMRGLELNKNLLAVGAEFVREDVTCPGYRLWSINDKYPAMIRDLTGEGGIHLEIWKLSPEALVTVLQQEPPGLCIGKIQLQNGESVLGVLGEPHIIEGQTEITVWGGWREYILNHYI